MADLTPIFKEPKLRTVHHKDLYKTFSECGLEMAYSHNAVRGSSTHDWGAVTCKKCLEKEPAAEKDIPLTNQDVFNTCGTCPDCLYMLELGLVVDLESQETS